MSHVINVILQWTSYTLRARVLYRFYLIDLYRRFVRSLQGLWRILGSGVYMGVSDKSAEPPWRFYVGRCHRFCREDGLNCRETGVNCRTDYARAPHIFSSRCMLHALLRILKYTSLIGKLGFIFVRLGKVASKIRYICLKCHNRWTSRSGRPRVLRCTNLECHSRHVVELADLKKVVLEVKQSLQTLGQPLQGPTVFEALLAVRRLRLKAGLSLPDSLDLFKWIYKLATTFDPEQEDFEEALDRIERQQPITFR